MQEIFTACYLILGNRISLIDSGLPETWQKVIIPYLRRIRREPGDVSLILHTHNHGDHVGSDLAIKEATGAEIAVHEAGADALENPKAFRARYLKEYGKYMTKDEQEKVEGRPLGPSIKVDRLLRDGDILNLGTLKLEVIHTPGHSPDAVCLYDREGRIVFTGDSIVGGSTKIDDFIIVQDVDAYMGSIARLTKMDLRLMLTDHPYLPYETAILRGSYLKSYLKYSAEINIKIADQIPTTLQTAKKPMSASEISYIVCPLFRRKIQEGVTNRTILAHLQKLTKQGKVVEIMGPECVLWALKA